MGEIIPLIWKCLCAIGLISVMLVSPASALQISEVTSTEVCAHEDYTSQCQYDEILVITKATYGHIRQGRCARRDLGHFGCFTDVTSYMESVCSEQRSCTISMKEVVKHNVVPDCADGLATLMEVSHVCVTGQPSVDVCSTVAAVASERYFFSKQAMKEHCPSPGYVTLQAKPGQQVKVNIILLDNGNDQQEIGGVVEDGIEHAYEISTNTDGRLVGQYTSKTNSITLVIGEAQHTHIIAFQGTGCTNIETPHNSILGRNGDNLVVRCPHTEQVWNLKCIGTRWIGAVGTCEIPTAEPPIIQIAKDNEYEDNSYKRTQDLEIISKELIIGIIVSATILLCCLVFVVGYFCSKGMKRKYLPNKDYEKCEMVAVDGTMARILKADNGQTWQSTMHPTMTRNDHVPVVAMDRDFLAVNANNI
ncbi:hypothetical protein CAPTEDRAFT_211542 [Capitella teleta]|uniref:SUEL-type lectin domain-containing protein n=1 Tax=Capitella teleta TaxID=283909 RepID=R7TAH1_CAPTE|nr:hypothetical protein CAPTEDRAFT_211542 [Capitella teleta]|eukprot:ELT90704.1 hypothetical protein CAPTEDRAFT_211542 [Capitella teleta]